MIENPRNYQVHDVDNLRRALLEGRQAERDPRRKFFYQIDDVTSTYYIHISPVTGNVVLLAKWLRQPQDCYQDTGSMVA